MSQTLVRQALFYALLCAGTGASLPFMPLWLKQNGMSPNEIGWILAVPLVGRAVSGPLAGIWADRFQKYRTPIALLALVATAFYALMPWAGHWPYLRFAALMVLYTVGYSGITNITPLLDAMTLQLSRIERFAFGAARAAGSASFIFANICLGYLVQGSGTQAVVIWMTLTAGLACLSAHFLLPPHRRFDVSVATPAHPPHGHRRLATLLSSKGYVALLATIGCLQAAHSYYYAFSTLIWQKQGLSANTCGWLWATGVAGEFVFLSLGTRLRQMLGPWTLLLIGAAAGIVRWTLMALPLPLDALWMLQLLHGLSFGAVYVAGLELVHLLVPPGFEGLGQAVNSALAGGSLIGLGTLASGPVFEAFAGQGYDLMAGLAAIGAAGALWMYASRTQLMAAADPAR